MMATKRLKKPPPLSRRRRSETRPKTSRRPFSSGRKRRTDSSSVRVTIGISSKSSSFIIIDRAKVSSSFESSKSQTFLSLAGQSVPSCDGRPSASAAFESSFDDVSFVRSLYGRRTFSIEGIIDPVPRVGVGGFSFGVAWTRRRRLSGHLFLTSFFFLSHRNRCIIYYLTRRAREKKSDDSLTFDDI